MKIKKVLPVLVSLVMAGGVLAGCAHTHTYSNEWTKAEDGSGHYHVATCHPEEHDEKKDHVYDNDADTTCNDCGYVRTVTTENPTPENPTPENPTPEEQITYSPLPADKKIYVVGDSTVCSFNDSYFIPRYGYGTQLHEYLNVTSNQIVNLAISGRSSKSFLTEGNYTTLTSSISEGDYLIIGFGHNDEKSDDSARYTTAKDTDTYTTAGSFQKTLYDNYVKMAKDKGATPILCTPVTRYDASGAYTGSKVHVTAAGDYVKAIKTLGTATETTVVDLTSLTVAEYKKDNAAAIYYHAHTKRKGAAGASTGTEEPDGRDDTHLSKFGAKMVAYQFANALKTTNSPLRAHVKENISAPTKTADYADAVNTSYVKPDYKPFDATNTTATNLTGNWYATAMGELGGESTTPFTISYADSKFTVGSKDQKGKITCDKDTKEGVDGFAAAFMQIDKAKNFTATATVKVTSLNGGDKAASSQSAFGLMLRDDIIINKRDTTLASNYVAAGAFATSNNAVFCRENKKLATKGTISVTEGATYTVSITRVGQSVDVSISNGQTTVSENYTDFDFLSVDNDYMYLCLFATRSIYAEFTQVTVTFTGDSQGA